MRLSRWTGSPDRRHFALLALAAGVLLLGAIRLGHLAGYDDAMFAAEAKNIVRSGQWLPLMMRGAPAGEHPPLFVWMQALSFQAFGVSDPAAKLPAALCGLGVVLLVWWLAWRLLGDAAAAGAAMFVMLATPYFLKYSNRAMTDVPTTFFFVCAVCCWVQARRSRSWYLAAGLFTGLALVTRGLIGFALPLAFGMDYALARRHPQESTAGRAERRYLLAGLFLAIAPLAAWYAYFLTSVPGFLAEQRRWLDEQVYGGLTPAWRRYTGAPEYIWMLAKSYWPWLPAMAAGAALVVRQRRRELYVLLCWAGAVFFLCAITRSRVLRYMLPAYPAFSILAAAAITSYVPRAKLSRALDWAAPLAVIAALGIVTFKPPSHHAAVILPLVQAMPAGERPWVALYDEGQPRWDEANQLEWYGECIPRLVRSKEELREVLRRGEIRHIIADRRTYEEEIARLPHLVRARSGHLIYARLEGPG